MTTPKTIHKDNLVLLVTAVSVSVLLILSSLSTLLVIRGIKSNSTKDQVVLGTTTTDDEKYFWINFLKDNPYYYPGWKRLNEISHEVNDIRLQEQSGDELIKLKPVGM